MDRVEPYFSLKYSTNAMLGMYLIIIIKIYPNFSAKCSLETAYKTLKLR